MYNPEYESRIDDLVSMWTEEVYDRILGSQVMPAVKICAFASLQDLTEVYDVSAIFPMFSDEMELPDHYANGLFSRLSGACTSIGNALRAIHAHMDCHAAVAVARRAHEALWQVCWLYNPVVDADTRVKRLVSLTKSEINLALRFWGSGINPGIATQLEGFLENTNRIADLPVYRPSSGWTEYMEYFESSDDGSVDDAARSWSIMSNMTHPNLVFDWIIQTQDDPQNEMDRLQLIPTVDAIGMVGNLCTSIMQQAKMSEEHVVDVNATVERSWSAAAALLELRRA